MATQPIVNGVPLPWPGQYKSNPFYLGGAAVMADGSQVTDLVQANVRRNWSLSWQAITAADLATLQTAFDAMKSSSVEFVDMSDGNYAAVLDGMAELDIEAVLTANGIRYDCELKIKDAESVTITEVDYDPAGDDILGVPGESLTLQNVAETALTLTGWEIHDSIFPRYTFPAFTFGAGATVVIYTKSGADTATELYMDRGVAIWNNNPPGDSANLYNRAGVLVDKMVYAL